MNFWLTQNDTLPTLQIQLSDTVGAVDITSGTSVLYWRLITRATGSGLFSGVASVVGSPTSGLINYTFTAGNTLYPGVYAANVKVNFSNSTMTFPNDGSIIRWEIVPNL